MTALWSAHLAHAVERHRRHCRDNGIAVPVELFALVELLSGHQELPEPWPLPRPGDDAGVPMAVDFTEAGRLLSVSTSTVRRLVKAGDLAAVDIGQRGRRIARAELVRYLDEKGAR